MLIRRSSAMAASSRLIITEAERRFPVRIRIAVPPEGLGTQLDQMKWWLDENSGAGNWAMAPAGLRGVANDALAIYCADAALASKRPPAPINMGASRTAFRTMMNAVWEPAQGLA